MKEIKFYLKEKENFISNNNFVKAAEICNYLGNLYSENGSFDKALREHKDELKISEQLSDNLGQAIAHRRISECYASLQKFNKANYHVMQYKKFSVLCNDLSEIQRSYTTLGRLNLLHYEYKHSQLGTNLNYDTNLKDLEEIYLLLYNSEKEFVKAIELCHELRNALNASDYKLMLTRSYINVAIVHEIKRNTVTAQTFLKKALKIAQFENFKDELIKIYTTLAEISGSILEFESAFKYAEKNLLIAEKLNNKDLRKECHEKVFEYLLKIGDFKIVLKHIVANTNEENIVKINEYLQYNKICKLYKLLRWLQRCSNNDDDECASKETLVNTLSQVYEAIGDMLNELKIPNQAIHYYAKAAAFGACDQRLASLYYSISQCYVDMGHFEKALLLSCLELQVHGVLHINNNNYNNNMAKFDEIMRLNTLDPHINNLTINIMDPDKCRIKFEDVKTFENITLALCESLGIIKKLANSWLQRAVLTHVFLQNYDGGHKLTSQESICQENAYNDKQTDNQLYKFDGWKIEKWYNLVKAIYTLSKELTKYDMIIKPMTKLFDEYSMSSNTLRKKHKIGKKYQQIAYKTNIKIDQIYVFWLKTINFIVQDTDICPHEESNSDSFDSFKSKLGVEIDKLSDTILSNMKDVCTENTHDDDYSSDIEIANIFSKSENNETLGDETADASNSQPDIYKLTGMTESEFASNKFLNAEDKKLMADIEWTEYGQKISKIVKNHEDIDGISVKSTLTRNEKGETALHTACIEGDLKRVQKLINLGHPVNVRDNCGWTPLHEACNYGHDEIVALLIQSGAHINDNGERGNNGISLSCDGITPLQDALYGGHVSTAWILIRHGARIDIPDDSKKYPIDALKEWKEQNLNDLSKKKLKEINKLYEYLISTNSSALNNKNFNYDNNMDSDISDEVIQTIDIKSPKRKKSKPLVKQKLTKSTVTSNHKNQLNDPIYNPKETCTLIISPTKQAKLEWNESLMIPHQSCSPFNNSLIPNNIDSPQIKQETITDFSTSQTIKSETCSQLSTETRTSSNNSYSLPNDVIKLHIQVWCNNVASNTDLNDKDVKPNKLIIPLNRNRHDDKTIEWLQMEAYQRYCELYGKNYNQTITLKLQTLDGTFLYPKDYVFETLSNGDTLLLKIM